MSSLDNLEDMLAALEGDNGRSQGRSQGVSRQDSVVEAYQNVDSIDDFLDSLEPEPPKTASKSAPQSAPKKQDYSVAPPVHHSSEYSDILSAPREVEVDESAAHASHANANWFDPTHQAEFRSPQEAANAFEKEGYSIHVNKGKFIAFTGGSASDFRLKGTTSTKVGYIHAITLRALDDYGSPAKINNPRDFIGASLTHRESGDDIQVWYRDNGDCTYDLAFFAQRPGTVRLEIKLCGNPMFDIDIQVDEKGRSLWVARPQLPAEPGKRFLIDIVAEDGSRPEGVAPFEVQTMGDVEELKLLNNGDGTYRFTCTPQSNGYITLQITLHGQPIKGSPVTVQVGQKQPMYVKQQSRGVDEKAISGVSNSYNTPAVPQTQAQVVTRVSAAPAQAVNRPAAPVVQATFSAPASDDFYGQPTGYAPRQSNAMVSNDDLNALLDELGG